MNTELLQPRTDIMQMIKNAIESNLNIMIEGDMAPEIIEVFSSLCDNTIYVSDTEIGINDLSQLLSGPKGRLVFKSLDTKDEILLMASAINLGIKIAVPLCIKDWRGYLRSKFKKVPRFLDIALIKNQFICIKT